MSLNDPRTLSSDLREPLHDILLGALGFNPSRTISLLHRAEQFVVLYIQIKTYIVDLDPMIMKCHQMVPGLCPVNN